MVATRSELQSWHRRAERLAEEGADFITAGFPCQDISLAGTGAGLAGARSGLVWPLLRTIRLVRPRGALLENVAALLGRGLGAILGHLATVGYDAEWHCIPASAVGAPHRRDRIWILLGDANQHPHASPVLGPSIFRSEPNENSRSAGGMAHPESDGRIAWRPGDAPQIPTGRQSDRGSLGADLCDANVSGLAIRESQSRDVGEELAPIIGADRWSAQSELRRMADGLPKRLDVDWAEGEWPGVPRCADGVPNRVDRLRCCGNAVVPEIPYRIGKAILEAEGLTYGE